MSDNPNLKHNYGTIDKDYGVFLATRPEPEDGPIYMVNLMKYHEVAQYSDDTTPGSKPVSGREADDRYNPASILSRIGATIVFAGDVVGNADSPEDWDRIAIVRYPTRKSFIDMQSRKDFGEKHVHKAAGMKRTIIVCCRPEDLSLDTRERPTPADHWLTMVVSPRHRSQNCVRRNAERNKLFSRRHDHRRWPQVVDCAVRQRNFTRRLQQTRHESRAASGIRRCIRHRHSRLAQRNHPIISAASQLADAT